MADPSGLRLRRWADALAVDHEPGLTTAQLLLTNHDLKPVEPARRQWKSWNFVGFWIADSFNINTWMISSSMVSAGLSWWQSWLCVWIGYAIAGGFVCATGRIGATYHIGFPVVNRASFGEKQHLCTSWWNGEMVLIRRAQASGAACGPSSTGLRWRVSGTAFSPTLEASACT